MALAFANFEVFSIFVKLCTAVHGLSSPLSLEFCRILTHKESRLCENNTQKF